MVITNSSLGLAGVGQKGNGTERILCKRTDLQLGTWEDEQVSDVKR